MPEATQSSFLNLVKETMFSAAGVVAERVANNPLTRWAAPVFTDEERKNLLKEFLGLTPVIAGSRAVTGARDVGTLLIAAKRGKELHDNGQLMRTATEISASLNMYVRLFMFGYGSAVSNFARLNKLITAEEKKISDASIVSESSESNSGEKTTAITTISNAQEKIKSAKKELAEWYAASLVFTLLLGGISTLALSNLDVLLRWMRQPESVIPLTDDYGLALAKTAVAFALVLSVVHQQLFYGLKKGAERFYALGLGGLRTLLFLAAAPSVLKKWDVTGLAYFTAGTAFLEFSGFIGKLLWLNHKNEYQFLTPSSFNLPALKKNTKELVGHLPASSGDLFLDIARNFGKVQLVGWVARDDLAAAGLSVELQALLYLLLLSLSQTMLQVAAKFLSNDSTKYKSKATISFLTTCALPIPIAVGVLAYLLRTPLLNALPAIDDDARNTAQQVVMLSIATAVMSAISKMLGSVYRTYKHFLPPALVNLLGTAISAAICAGLLLGTDMSKIVAIFLSDLLGVTVSVGAMAGIYSRNVGLPKKEVTAPVAVLSEIVVASSPAPASPTGNGEVLGAQHVSPGDLEVGLAGSVNLPSEEHCTPIVDNETSHQEKKFPQNPASVTDFAQVVAVKQETPRDQQSTGLLPLTPSSPDGGEDPDARKQKKPNTIPAPPENLSAKTQNVAAMQLTVTLFQRSTRPSGRAIRVSKPPQCAIASSLRMPMDTSNFVFRRRACTPPPRPSHNSSLTTPLLGSERDSQQYGSLPQRR